MFTPAQGIPSPLVHVRGIPHAAEYYQAGRPGARPELYLHPATETRLRTAQVRLRQLSTTAAKYGLLVWDGYRSREVQQDIFDEYVAVLMEERSLRLDDARKAALTFVSDPDSVFPHGTGGTVDLTLTINGEPAEMGTGFDDFSPRAHRDWFLDNPPTDEQSWEAHRNRVVLYRAMRTAGFVGLEDEWWHFEWGTARWATTTGRDAVLTTALVYPPSKNPLPSFSPAARVRPVTAGPLLRISPARPDRRWPCRKVHVLAIKPLTLNGSGKLVDTPPHPAPHASASSSP